MEQKTCPRCGQKLLYIHSVFDADELKYEVLCCWCNYKSKIFETITEAINNYDNEIF